MIYPLTLVGLRLLAAAALPSWVYDLNRRFAEPGSASLQPQQGGSIRY
jgi:hypothetical protein